jgi:hypothetical protein
MPTIHALYQCLAANGLQPLLRSGFRQQLKAGVGCGSYEAQQEKRYDAERCAKRSSSKPARKG